MESSVKETNECKDHFEDIEFLCLDPDCDLNVKSCMLCIKENHFDCKDELIIEKEHLKEILSEDSQEKINKLQKMRKKIFEQNLKFYEEKCDLRQKSFNKILEKGINLKKINLNTLIIIKTIFKIEQNAEGKLTLNPIITKEDKNFELSKKEYKEKIKILIKDYIKKIKNLKINPKINLKIKKFIKSPKIKITKTPKGLLFERLPECLDSNYFSCIYKEPFKKKTKISIKILEVYKSDSFLNMGFLKKSNFSLINKINPIVNFGSNAHSYCGTSKTGLNGTYFGGLKKEMEVYLEYDPVCKIINVTRSDGNVCLSTAFEEECFFFLTLYHKVLKCLVNIVDF